MAEAWYRSFSPARLRSPSPASSGGTPASSRIQSPSPSGEKPRRRKGRLSTPLRWREPVEITPLEICVGRRYRSRSCAAATTRANTPPLPPPTPPPKRARTPTLDLAAHSNIADAILRHADRAVLLALRATCRALRRRVDQRLAAHVLIGVRLKPSFHITLTGWQGDIPGVASVWPWYRAHSPHASPRSVTLSPSGPVFPMPPPRDSPVPSSPSRRNKPRPAPPPATLPSTHILLHTNVVDIRGPITRDCLNLCPHVGHIPVVRFRENSIGYRPKACQDGHYKVIAFALLDPDSDRGQHLCPVPSSARSLVGVLKFLPDTPAPMPSFDQPDSLTQVTLIFRAINPSRARAYAPSRSYFSQRPESLIRGLARIICQRVPLVTYTIVGLDQLDLMNIGYALLARFGPVPPNYAQHKLLATVRVMLHEKNPEASNTTVVRAMDTIVFRTFREYTASRSARDLDLELREDVAVFA